jgi:hypothetical protein
VERYDEKHIVKDNTQEHPFLGRIPMIDSFIVLIILSEEIPF